MKMNKDKTKEQLIGELAEMRRRVAELESFEAERKQAEEKINHLNLTLRSIRNINQLITREKNRDRLLQGVCNNLVEGQCCYDVWVALLDDSRKLVAYAEVGLGKDFSPLLEQLKEGKLPACGQKAIRRSQVVITEDPYSMCTQLPVIP